MRIVLQTIPAFHHHVRSDRLRHVRRLAHLMDSEFTIPGTSFRFGLDPLLGLFLPGVGSVASAGVSLALIATMMRHGASGHVLVRMLLNVLIDTVVGSIPIVGNLFDFAYRANDKNLELLRRHYDEGEYQGSGRGLIVGLVVAIVVVCGLIGWVGFTAVSWLYHLAVRV
jgi:hypothetical protein